ncbi:hypothetical protein, partial [Rhodanobacter koreensis]
MPAQPFAAHLQNWPQERLAKKTTVRIIRGPQSPKRRKTDRRDLEKASTRVLTVFKSDVEWAAHPGRNVPGVTEQSATSEKIFD